MADLARLQAYLRERLGARGMSMRALSTAMGRDPNYLAQLFSPQLQRTAPTPDDLRLAARTLGVPFAELLEVAWGVTAEELLEGRAAAERPDRDRLAAALHGTNAAQRQAIFVYITFIKERWGDPPPVAGDDDAEAP